MLFRILRRIPVFTSPNSSKTNLTSINKLLKTASCALILTASSSVFADTHFGFGLSDGEKKVTWLQKDVSVSDDITSKFDEHLQDKEDELSVLDDYDTYIKGFKLYMVFKRNF